MVSEFALELVDELVEVQQLYFVSQLLLASLHAFLPVEVFSSKVSLTEASQLISKRKEKKQFGKTSMQPYTLCTLLVNF